jgi:hypothetical protein
MVRGDTSAISIRDSFYDKESGNALGKKARTKVFART